MTLVLPAPKSAAADSFWARIRSLQFDPLLLLVMAIVAVVHLPSIDAYFHGDDFVAMTDLVSKPLLPHLVAVYTFADSNFYWRPLGLTYDAAIYHLFGLSATAFHIGSVVIFEGTLVLLYWLTKRMGLPQPVALGACLILGLFPNHVVSVAWITNTSRLMAVFFFIASLLLIEKASRSRKFSHEAAAWLLFLLAGLSDETALGLAPLPILYSLLVRQGREDWRPMAARAFVFVALAAALIPLQFMFTTDDEPRLADYGFGIHIAEQLWSLASQLVLPLSDGGPMTMDFESIGAVQWTAGALAIAGGVLLFLLGSWRMRFLVFWVAISLAPFALWDVPNTAPRYVYMAAPPFAIVAAWLGYALWQQSFGRIRIAAVRLAPVAAIAIAIVAWGSVAHVERNDAWAQATQPYSVLAHGLKTALPEVDPGSRIIIYYGVWGEFAAWPDSVVRTIYKDPTLDAVNVPRQLAEDDTSRRRRNDVVVFYADGKFIAVPNSIVTVSEQPR